MKKFITISLISVFSVAIMTGVALYVLHVVDTNKQQLQQEQEQQYIDNVLFAINEWNTAFENSENQAYRIVLFNGLHELKNEFQNAEVYHETTREDQNNYVLTSFDDTLLSMENRFFEHYLSEITEVGFLTMENQIDAENFINQTLSDIDELQNEFLNVTSTSDNEELNISHYASSTYKDFVLYEAQFQNSTFINDTILSEVERLSAETEVIVDRIISDGIIGYEKSQNLQDEVDAIDEELLIQLSADYNETVLNEFSKVHDIMLNWFDSYYEEVINEITNREKANQNDLETVRQQIVDLESVKTMIEEDNVIEVSTFNIDDSINVLNADIQEIEDRLEAERIAAEAAARARQQRSRATRTTRTAVQTTFSGSETTSTGTNFRTTSSNCVTIISPPVACSFGSTRPRGFTPMTTTTYCDNYLMTEAPY